MPLYVAPIDGTSSHSSSGKATATTTSSSSGGSSRGGGEQEDAGFSVSPGFGFLQVPMGASAAEVYHFIKVSINDLSHHIMTWASDIIICYTSIMYCWLLSVIPFFYNHQQFCGIKATLGLPYGQATMT